MAVKPGTRRFAIGLALLLVLAGLAGWKAFTAQAGAEYWTDYADTGWYDPDYATFTIDTPAKLAGIAKLVNGGLSDDGYSIDGFNGRVLEIAGDLNVSAYTWVPIGTADHPFRGTLIAAGGVVKTIGGMTVDNAEYAGFIGYMDEATVGGLTFTGGRINLTSVTQAVYAGAAVGKMTNNSTLYDINVAADMQISVATVTGVTYAGGIVGQSEGVVSNVENHAAITASGGDVYAGGVAGQVYGTGLKLKKIWNYGTVNAISYGNEASAGGIVGYAPVSVNMGDDNTIILNAGAVSSSGGNRNYSGGIVGRASWTASFSEDTSNSGQVSISAPAASGSYAGGLAGSMDSLVVGRTHAFAFNNTGAVTNNGGTNVYTGGIAGYIEGALTWDDNLANNAGVSASGMSQVYSGGLFGSVTGELSLSGTAANAGAVSVSGGALPVGPDNAYTGGLTGYAGSRLLFNNPAENAYANNGAITVIGGTGVYTGGISSNRAYARAPGGGITENSDNVSSAGNITVAGNTRLYTGGFIGIVQDGVDKTVYNAAFAGGITVTAAASDLTNLVSTGGIVGYFADGGGIGALSQDSFSGTIVSTGGGSGTYTGGIAGYMDGGTINNAASGNTAGSYAAITADGVIGAVAGYMQGTVDAAAVKYFSGTLTTHDGFIGGIAGAAGGAIAGAAVGDEAAAGSDSVKLAAANGIDRMTAGGVVGHNTGSLTVTDSGVTRIGLLSEDGRSGYNLGAVAGSLTPDAHIGTEVAPVTVKQVDIQVNASDSFVGGAVGRNQSAEVYLNVENLSIDVPASGVKAGGIAGLANIELGNDAASGSDALTVRNLTVSAAGDALEIGGLFGENAADTPQGLADHITIVAEGSDNELGGIAGHNTGTITNVQVNALQIESGGNHVEAGGIAGHSQTPGGQTDLAGIHHVRVLAGEEALIKATGVNAIIGGIVGSAQNTEISDFQVNGELPDYAMITAAGTNAQAGGIAGRSENGAIIGDGELTNADNLVITGTTSAASSVLGGLIGTSDKTRLDQVFSGSVNLIVSSPGTTVGGMAGYNLGTDEAVLADNNTAALSIKVNDTGVSAIVGGIVGVNDKRGTDPENDPVHAVSTIQNSRMVGTIWVNAPDSVTGGMVGENRSLIANGSISDKISVSSIGESGILGGIAGVNAESGTLYYTYSNANLTLKGKDALAGGLSGENRGGVIASYVDIDVTGDAYGTNGHSVYLGGLIGRNSGTVDKSYSVSKVTANGSYTIVGGLVGAHAAGSISNSYTAGEVAANADHSYAGGLVGRLTDGTVETAYSASRVTAGGGALAGGFAGRYDNASKELLYRTYYVKDVDNDINGDLPDFAEGNYIWLNVYARLSTILSTTLQNRDYFPALSGWDFDSTWRYGSMNAAYQYPELVRTANTGGGGGGNDVNANINWYLRDTGAISFELRTEAELAGLAAVVNGKIPGVAPFSFEDRTIKMLNPIHIQSNQWVPIGIDEDHPFNGTFDGDSQLIDGLSAPTDDQYAGLFGVIGEQGKVRKVILEPLSVSGEQFTGALAGLNRGEVSDVEIRLLNGTEISGGTVGGILGKNTGTLARLSLRMEGGSRIEAVGANSVAGGLIGDNSAAVTPETVSFTLVDGSVGSGAENAVIGGMIGKQAGDVIGMEWDMSANFRISSTGAGDTLGGMIGQHISGKADKLSLALKNGSLEALGAGSVLGGLIGQSAADSPISNITLTGMQDGPQLKGSGTVGGIVGVKNGKGSQTYDLDHVQVSGLTLAADGGNAQVTVGGIAGRLANAAARQTEASGTIRAAGDGVTAGGIVGRSDDSLLDQADAQMAIEAAAQTGGSAIGGAAGILAASNPDRSLDFGKAAPFYPGLYNTSVSGISIAANGTDQQADLFVGGIVGRNETASIYYSQSRASLDVTGGKKAVVGGIAGFSDGIIVNAAAGSKIGADSSNVYEVGGAVGQAAGGEIHYVRAVSKTGEKITIGSAVTKPGMVPSTYVGGLIGMGDDTAITDSYADLPVEAFCDNPDTTIYAGGFAGLLGGDGSGSGTVDRAYAKGDIKVQGITGSYVGGFAGSVDRYSITGAYADGEVANTGFDTQSGGFAGVVERNAIIRQAYAAQERVATIGVNHPARSYAGGFAGYNDGIIEDAFARVPAITLDAAGANVFSGGFIGYNFRNGKVTSSDYLSTLNGVGRNLGTAEVNKADKDLAGSYGYENWNFDLEASFLSGPQPADFTILNAEQLNAAVRLYNDETALAYLRLFNRTATVKPEMTKLSLGADIVMDDHDWVPFGIFAGQFDGQGKSIAGLTGTAEGRSAYGFAAENNGTIANVSFVDGSITGGENTGLVAGINHAGATISGIKAGGAVKGSDRTGGIAGTNAGNMTGIELSSMSVSGSDYTGGIAGTNAGNMTGIKLSSMSVSGSEYTGGAAGTNEGNMTGIELSSMSVSGADYTGGLTGMNKGVIEDAAVNATLAAAGEFAGGIAGSNEGTISQAYSSGSMNGHSAAALARGGIAGSNLITGEISESFSYMDITAQAEQAAVGGIAGVNRGTIHDVYYSGHASAEGSTRSQAGGIVGYAAEGAIRDSLSVGEVTAVTGGRIVPGKSDFGGIAGRKEAAAVIAGTTFNKQMLKANTAYYEADGKRVSGSAAESAGMTSRELAGGSLPAKLNAGVWRGVPGFFPQLAAFNASDASKLSTAAVILDGQDTINSIRNGFELTQGDEMTWSADPKEVSLQPVSGSLEGSLKTSGSAVLTVTLDGAARSFMLNAPAPRFAESAQAPTADSESETFTDKAAVSLSTVEPAGTIYYTLDGSEPDGRSRLYTGPIVLMDTTTIKAVTIAEDKEDSEVFSGTWTKKESFGWFVFFPPPAPQPAVTASIGSKKVQMDGKTAVTMARNSKLTLSVPEGQMIYYTTDGSSPTKDSKLYKGDILVTKNMTIKFITDSDDKVITINCVVENAKYELKSDAKDVKYISGYNSRQFKPDTALTRYEITEILSQLLDKEDVAVANVFSDVDRSKEDLVAFFTSAGILSGYPDNTFRGKNGLTRAEFVVILSRVLNLNVSQGGKSEFSDAASHWAKNYIAAFAKAGYIQGFPDGTFKPDSKLTRAQAVVLINNIIGRGKQQTAGHKYDDVPSRHWAYSAIMSAVKE